MNFKDFVHCRTNKANVYTYCLDLTYSIKSINISTFLTLNLENRSLDHRIDH